jgi:hypothetical protein
MTNGNRPKHLVNIHKSDTPRNGDTPRKLNVKVTPPTVYMKNRKTTNEITFRLTGHPDWNFKDSNDVFEFVPSAGFTITNKGRREVVVENENEDDNFVKYLFTLVNETLKEESTHDPYIKNGGN